MELDYFEIEIDGRIHPVPKHKLGTYEKSLGKTGFSITVWDSNIEAVKQVVSQHDIQHLKVSTSDLEFLKDSEFHNVIGIELSGEIKDIQPLEKLNNLTFLTLLNNRKGKINFENIPSLELLHCDFSERYENLESLANLKNLYLRKYTSPNFIEISNLTKLEELHLLFSKSETLKGIEQLNKLQKITLEECKNLVSLNGVEKISTLRKLIITDCRNIKDFSFASKLNSQCVALVDGKNIDELQDLEIDHIEILVANLKELETSEQLIFAIKEHLFQLENCKAQNWKEKLVFCITSLNELSLKFNEIYTEEREEIISTIEYVLKDFDSEIIEKIVDEHRIW